MERPTQVRSEKSRDPSDEPRSRPSGRGGRPPRGRFSGWRLLYWFAVVAAFGALCIFGVGFYYAQDLPDISDLKPVVTKSSVTVVADDGSTIANYGDVYGEWLNFDEIPPVLIKAVVSTEDRRFFEHPGIDLRGMARALFEDAVAGHIVQGGSTITQQLAKNVFLTPQRTIRRKIQEIILAIWLEEKLSKQQILSAYLNRTFFGARSYGIDAASRTYFGHSARHLTLEEAAMLAGLLKAPSAFSPAHDFEAAMDRSSVVLDNMVAAGYLSKTKAALAKAHPPHVLDQDVSDDNRYFTDWIVDSLPPEIAKRKEALIVQTTFDPKTQAAAERAITGQLSSDGQKRHIGQGALVALGPDGSVRAMVGGKSYVQSQYNRVTQARRQTGSSFKLFVYLTALQAGLSPDDVRRDSPIIIDGWEPKNYEKDFKGDVTLREAFADSINTVAVKVAEEVDLQRIIATAKRMGITSPIVPTASMALGTSGVSLLEMTGAYDIVANGGVKVAPFGIVSIRGSHGETLYQRSASAPEQVIDQKAEAEITSMLRSVVTDGTGRAAQLPWFSAGKTGTTQDSRDAWFIGFASDEQGRVLTAGVWMGNDDNTAMRHVVGGAAPAEAWHEFMLKAHDGGYLAPAAIPEARPEAPPPPPEDSLFDRIRKKLFGD